MKRLAALAVMTLPLALAACSHPAPVAYYPAPPPPAYAEIGQQGYHDGFAAADRDIRENRSPDFARHPRFRRPPVPPPAFADYRQGFRRGYEDFLHHGAPPPGE